MGHSVYNITAAEDRDRLRMFVNPENSVTNPVWRKYINVHLKKAGPRTESAVYEVCSLVGMQRPSSQDEVESTSSDSSTATPTNDVRCPVNQLLNLCNIMNRFIRC